MNPEETDPLTTLLSIQEKAMETPWRARADATVSTARDIFGHEVALLKPTTHEGLDPGQLADNAAAVASAMNALPRLVAELREAQADARRLDWLEASKRRPMKFGNGWCMDFTPTDAPKHPTLRAAIDAAMAQEEAQ